MAHEGAALLEIISRTKFTKEEIADALGIHRRTIYLWASKEKLDSRTIDKVGDVIGVDIRATMPLVFAGHITPVAIKKSKKAKTTLDNSMAEYWREKHREAMDEINDLKEQLLKYQLLMKDNLDGKK